MVHLQERSFLRGNGGCFTCLVKTVCSVLRLRNNLFCRNVHLQTDRNDLPIPWFDLDKLESMSRKELQRLCKKFGLTENAKTSKLLTDLKEFHGKHLSDSTSILYSPFFVSISRKNSHKARLPMNAAPDENLNLLSSVKSSKQWINGEAEKLRKRMKSNGIANRTAKNDGGVAKANRDDEPFGSTLFLNKKVSVSKILNSTATSLFMTSRWQKSQIEVMGKENIKEHKNKLSKIGSTFHSHVNSILQGSVSVKCNVPKSVQGLLESISRAKVLNVITKNNVLSTEEYVTHSSIGFSGRFDCLAIYKGVPCVIEWKTSQSPRPSLQSCYDAPLQVVAYAGAINSHPGVKIPVTNCMIVVSHHDGSKADVHWMDLDTCKVYWQQWLLKVLAYKEKAENSSIQNKAKGTD